jgi:hypothetical protein
MAGLRKYNVRLVEEMGVPIHAYDQTFKNWLLDGDDAIHPEISSALLKCPGLNLHRLIAVDGKKKLQIMGTIPEEDARELISGALMCPWYREFVVYKQINNLDEMYDLCVDDETSQT